MQVLLQEAARLTGKSEATVRRLTKKPGAKNHVSKDPEGRLLIGLDFLYKHYPVKVSADPTEITPPVKPKKQPTPATTLVQPEETRQPATDPEPLHPAYAVALASKDETIQELKHQLSKKDEQISSFQERAREQNIIMQSLQDKIKLLPAPTPAATPTPRLEWVWIGISFILLAALVTVMLLK